MHLDQIAKLERYSDDIRHAMKLANRQAIWHLNAFIGTQHLLIALAKEPTGLAGALLRMKGVHPRQLRRTMRHLLPRTWVLNLFLKLPLSKEVELVVSRAVEYAISEKHDSIGTGGMLLAMLRHDARTVEILNSLAADVPALEFELARYLRRFMVEVPGQVLQFKVIIYLTKDAACPKIWA